MNKLPVEPVAVQLRFNRFNYGSTELWFNQDQMNWRMIRFFEHWLELRIAASEVPDHTTVNHSPQWIFPRFEKILDEFFTVRLSANQPCILCYFWPVLGGYNLD